MSEPKEVHFFVDENKKNIEWYHNCFKEEADVYGESSQNYTKHPGYAGIPARMHSLLPDIKLLYLVRDPVERAISHYFHNWTVWNETAPIDKAMQPISESGYVNTSRYYFQLSQYLDYYSMDDILVVQSERLRNQRADVMSEIFQFIGVAPNLVTEAFTEEHNKSSERERQTSMGAFLTRTRLGRALKAIGKKMSPHSTVERVRETLRYQPERPKPSEEVLRKMRDYLEEDADQLRQLTGKPFSSWSV